MSPPIYYSKPSITELEIQYAVDAATNGWGENCYNYITKFERQFKNFAGVKHTIATSSCTGAMHMGLAALGVGPGDEVIMADINWVATVAPVVHLGATPILVDILPSTWCIDPEKVKAAITPRTKAIIAVHLYGNLCDMQALLEIGKEYDIPVIEDAAEAIGSYYRGSHAGSLGAFGTFSFHGSKTMTTGEGGMFTTNDEDLYGLVLTLSNHGRAIGQKKQFWPDMIGFKYKISNLAAAIGCAQLERVHELVERKRAIFSSYKRRLEGLPLKLNYQLEGCSNGFWMPTIVFDETVAIDRNKLLATFKEKNIEGRVFFWPVSLTPPFKECKHNVVSYNIHSRGINLPSYHDITEDEIGKVCTVVRKYVESIS